MNSLTLPFLPTTWGIFDLFVPFGVPLPSLGLVGLGVVGVVGGLPSLISLRVAGVAGSLSWATGRFVDPLLVPSLQTIPPHTCWEGTKLAPSPPPLSAGPSFVG